MARRLVTAERSKTPMETPNRSASPKSTEMAKRRIRDGAHHEVDAVVVGVLPRPGHISRQPLEARACGSGGCRRSLEPGAGRGSPAHRVDRGRRALDAQRDAPTRRGQAVGVGRVGHRRIEPGRVGHEPMRTGRHEGGAGVPGGLARHRRSAGADVDELQTLERESVRRRVVDLDELIRSACSTGEQLADHQVRE